MTCVQLAHGPDQPPHRVTRPANSAIHSSLECVLEWSKLGGLIPLEIKEKIGLGEVNRYGEKKLPL